MRTARLMDKSHQKAGGRLWRDSPCSMNYVLQNPSMEFAQRFNIGSIYYKDEVNKPKKVFTAFEKPDLLLEGFRRQIKQASKDKDHKNKSSRQKQKIKTKSLTTTMNTKFYEVPPKNDYKYDRGGVRSHLTGEYNVKQIQNRILTSRINFGSSRRVDLSRPLNFYPGPGTYDYDAQKPFTHRNMRTHSDFKRKYDKSQQNQEKKTERNSIDLSGGFK